jgi:GAF domain-containing protein
MKKRSKAGRAKARPRAALKRKRGNASKAISRRGSPRAGQIEVAQLTRDLREAQEQQAATAEVLNVVSRSTFDLPTTLNTLVKTAARLCRADKAQLLLPSSNARSVYSAASFGYSAEYNDYLKTITFAPGREGVVGRVLLRRKPVQIADVLADPEYRLPEVQRLGGFRTHLGLPLLRQDTTIGILLVSRVVVQPFENKHIELLSTFAAQAVIAIENARLLNELRQRTADLTESLEQQTATSEVLQVISSSPGDLEPVFVSMLEKAVRICDAKYGTLYLCEDSRLRLVAAHDVPEFFAARRGAAFDPAPGGGLDAVMSTKRAVQIPDLAATNSYTERHPGMVEAVEVAGIRTGLAVPMLKDDDLIGIVAIHRREVLPFTEEQIGLVKNFASQAVIAIENTRLLNELRQRTADLSQRTTDLTESLEQQTATSEVLQVISRLPDDLQPVFAALLEKAVRICDATFGNILRYDGDALHFVAAHNTPPAFVAVRAGSPFRPSPNGPFDRTLKTKKVVHVADIAAEKNYTEHRHPTIVEAVELGGVRTILFVPLLKGNDLIGVFALQRQEVRPFTDKQIELVKNFAAQAVIAIENARLLNELRESLQEQTATAEVLQVVSNSPGDLQPVLDTVCGTAARLCAADMAFMLRRDGDLYRAAAEFGFSPVYRDFLMTHPIAPDRGSITGRVVLERRAVHVVDVASDPEYTLSEATTLGKVRTQFGVPLLREGEPIGVICLARQRVEPFTERHIELVRAFADQAVIAIENARLLGELRQRTTDLAEALEQQTATADVLKVISRSQFDLQLVLDTLIETAARLCDAKRGVINTREGDLYHSVAFYNASPELVDYLRRHPSAAGRETITGRVILERRVIHAADLQADAEYSPALRVVAPTRTILGVPMFRGDNLVGVFVVFKQEVQPFTDKQIELVTTFADQAVIAIENTRLLRELREQTELDFGQKFNGLAMVRKAKYGACQFL